MLRIQKVPLIRTITSFSYKALTTFLSLESYYEQNPSQVLYQNNLKIGSLLKNRQLISAYKLFDDMSTRDVVTYNLLISGYGRYGDPMQAIGLYSKMVSVGLRESATTFSSVLSICGDAQFYNIGVQVQCRVILLGFESNLFIASSLVDLYMSVGLEDVGSRLFDEMPERNLAVWNLMLKWVTQLGLSSELVELYRKMVMDGVHGNGLTYCYLIRHCGANVLFNEGQQMHCYVIKSGLVDSNIFVANSLVDFYSACENLWEARKAFEAVPYEDVISWNSIVSVYASHDLLFEALEFVNEMQVWGKKPSIRSFVGLLNFSSRKGDLRLGKQIHCSVVKLGLDLISVYIQSSLIDMYGKCDDISSSVSIYESYAMRNLICSNSLMTAFLCHGMIGDVVEMFGFMLDERIGVDEVTLSTTLKGLAASPFASLLSCGLLHCCAIKSGYEHELAVSCSLIDAYAKCGHVELSRQVFEYIDCPNVFCFSSIINGYATNGYGRESVKMFEQMTQKGLIPDKVTFLCVLTGCNHSGLVKEAEWLFSLMELVYKICPEREHYSCMVDLLGRAGLLEKAESLLQQVPGKADCVMWSSLLRSCWDHKNEIIGRRAAKALMEFDPEDFAVYLQVSNFYSEIGQPETAMRVREFAMARKPEREFGYSSIEANNCDFH